MYGNPKEMGDYPPKQPEFPEDQPSPYGGTAEQHPTFPGDLSDPPAAEPDWTEHGTYMVVRASIVDMAK